ncbi:MAG: hypothetical protein JWN46_721 [Acidimicrobiales bacterium]|nr:hypothetical protein [Acidimicrobiales bacterium]
MAASPIERLWMVYDADGGLLGELSYAIGRSRGRRHCALCDISHEGLRRKPAFARLLRTIGVPAEVVHRNEQPPDLATFTEGRLACVVADTADGYELLVDAPTLDGCAGDVAAFSRELSTRLAARRA